MTKNVLTAIMVLSLVFALGCSEIAGVTETSSQATLEVIRKAEIGSKWQMNQMGFEVGAGDELSILLRLAAGDEVDGYFYVEKGNAVNFQITGNSLIYKASDKDEGSSEVDSDRFSFRANQEQGNTYTLTFRNSSENGQTRASIFLEVIYPVDGSLFMPIERK